MTVADLASFSLRRAKDLPTLCDQVHELVQAGLPFVLLAGGTDFMVEQEMRRPYAPGGDVPTVFDVSRMAELRGIALEGGFLRIGAGATFLELRRSPLVVEHSPLITRMAADVGALQIQARGTFGGNLATGSPAADGVAALAAHDAVIVVKSVHGERHIPFSELQTGYKESSRAPEEIITRIDVPLAAPGTHFHWRKIGTRRAQAISKVALAAVVTVEGNQIVRCGLGMASVGPTTALLPRTRALLLSTKLSALDDAAVDKAVEADISPIDDVRSTGAYRLHVAKAALRELRRELVQ